MSKYDLTVGYIPGKENTVADILSRWAYPASQAQRDISKHGTQVDRDEMRAMIKEEQEDGRECMTIKLKRPPISDNEYVRGLTVQPIRKRSAVKDPVPERFEFRRPLRTPADSAPSVGTSQGRPGTGTTESEAEGKRVTQGDVAGMVTDTDPGSWAPQTQDFGEEEGMGGQPSSPTSQ